MIKITKPLERPDGGDVSSNSVIDYTTRIVDVEKTVSFNLRHFFDSKCLKEKKQTIPSIIEFPYRLNKVCTKKEWEDLNDGEGSTRVLLEKWLKALIDQKLGKGFTKII